MTDLSHIVPAEDIILERTPTDTSCATSSWDEAGIYIHENGEVTFGTRTYYGGGGTPEAEWHKRTLVYGIAGARNGSLILDCDKLRKALAAGSELSELIGRIVAGHSVEWNGNNNVGKLSEDASDASIGLQLSLQTTDFTSSKEALDPAEWLLRNSTAAKVLEDLDLTADASDEAIEAAGASMVDEIASQNGVFTRSVEDVIRELIVEVKKAESEDEEDEAA